MPAKILRQLIFPWAFCAMLPLPMLLATNPAADVDVKCLYLGLASASLATEVFRLNGLPATRAEWLQKLLALVIALAFNVGLFILLGQSVGTASNIPFAWMAIFSAVPAIGMVPWLLQRIGQPFAVIILGGTIVALLKLLACVVARIVYGPDYIEHGYVAADWHTAKLMISLLWTLTTIVSIGMLGLSYRTVGRRHASEDTLS